MVSANEATAIFLCLDAAFDGPDGLPTVVNDDRQSQK